ncbi:MAG: GDSL-type esterase/lipase family protein [Gammaproteobacteria bacterium]|jgi:lysophospholipase L1-like esterase|nr:GDSL-type esterase/lipase family protein [Gammaproteobacteria bacterium]MDP6617596.1 GDSL-type esterase/lipase family protein [Gammaproteobacteria bacterium]MDP6694473.1 GDSL-type esterase/lipase family protein [Gammaproteobacteria bacterium]
MTSKQKGSALKALIVVVMSLAFILMLAEVGIRLVERAGIYPELFQLLGNANPPLDEKTGPGMYYQHPYTAYAMKPGYTRGDRERINSLGFRGEEISLDKPNDVYRIVATGGSTTFAVYLAWDQSYPYLLQKELRRRFGTNKIEVVNAGLTGSTTAESLHRMQSQIVPLDPDMVVIYHGFNDLLPRMFEDYSDDYYHFRRSDPNNPPGLTRFYLYRLFLRVFSPGAFHENNNLMNQVWKLKNFPSTDTERTRNFLESSKEAFKLNMRMMAALLKGLGIDVVLASFAIKSDIYHWTEHLPAYLWEIGIQQNNEAISEVADEFDLPVVPFADTPFVQASINRFKVKLFADSIHMVPAGNQLKAEIFADTIAPIVAAKLGVATPEPSIYYEQMRVPQTEQPAEAAEVMAGL